MSFVSVCEAIQELQLMDINPEEALSLITDIITNIIPLDLGQAQLIAKLQIQISDKSLSINDYACLALARQLQVPIYTGNQAFSKLQVENVIKYMCNKLD